MKIDVSIKDGELPVTLICNKCGKKTVKIAFDPSSLTDEIIDGDECEKCGLIMCDDCFAIDGMICEDCMTGKSKKCPICGKILNYQDYIRTNNYPREYLDAIWNVSKIKFGNMSVKIPILCCCCYLKSMVNVFVQI